MLALTLLTSDIIILIVPRHSAAVPLIITGSHQAVTLPVDAPVHIPLALHLLGSG